MNNFTRIVHLGSMKDTGDVFCKVVFENDNLSITGVEGPLKNGDVLGACGQIVMSFDIDYMATYAPGWNREMVLLFMGIWDEYHSNDMNIGTPLQRLALKICNKKFTYPEAYEHLKDVGAYIAFPDEFKEYKYGAQWIHEDVPTDVLWWLYDLPQAREKPAWV